MTHNLITINTDGGARGNPGPSAIGVTAKTADISPLFEISQFIGETTNNVAEYTAVIYALRYLEEHQISSEQISFVLDSELIVRQITGVYRIKEPKLQTLAAEVQKLIRSLRENNLITSVNFQNVPRSFNKRADQLVNQALDSR